MKKGISLFCLVLILLTTLCACGRPDGMSEDVYDLGKQALDLIDGWHAGKVAVVDGPLESIRSRLDAIEKRDDGKQTARSEYALNNSQYASLISGWISSFLREKDRGGDTYEAADRIRSLLK